MIIDHADLYGQNTVRPSRLILHKLDDFQDFFRGKGRNFSGATVSLTISPL